MSNTLTWSWKTSFSLKTPQSFPRCSISNYCWSCCLQVFDFPEELFFLLQGQAFMLHPNLHEIPSKISDISINSTKCMFHESIRRAYQLIKLFFRWAYANSARTTQATQCRPERLHFLPFHIYNCPALWILSTQGPQCSNQLSSFLLQNSFKSASESCKTRFSILIAVSFSDNKFISTGPCKFSQGSPKLARSHQPSQAKVPGFSTSFYH